MICASWTICARCASVSMAASRRAAVSVIDYTSVYYAVSIAGVKVIAQVKQEIPLFLRELVKQRHDHFPNTPIRF